MKSEMNSLRNKFITNNCFVKSDSADNLEDYSDDIFEASNEVSEEPKSAEIKRFYSRKLDVCLNLT